MDGDLQFLLVGRGYGKKRNHAKKRDGLLLTFCPSGPVEISIFMQKDKSGLDWREMVKSHFLNRNQETRLLRKEQNECKGTEEHSGNSLHGPPWSTSQPGFLR